MMIRVGCPSRGHGWRSRPFQRSGQRKREADRVTTRGTLAIGGSDTVTCLFGDRLGTHGVGASTWATLAGVAPAQSTAAKRPVVDHHGFRGRPAVCFPKAGSDDALTFAALDLSGGDKATILWSGTVGETGAGGIAFEHTASWSANAGSIIFNSDVGKQKVATGNAINGYVSAADLDGVEQVLLFTIDRAAAAAVDECKMYSDCALVAKGASTTDDNAGNFASATLTLGSRNDGSGIGQDGWAREFVLMSKLVTASEREALCRQQAWRANK